MKIGIVGSRKFSRLEFVEVVINQFNNPTDIESGRTKETDVLISGGAKGVDKFAEHVFNEDLDQEGIDPIIIRPDFEVNKTEFNKSDYYKRNKEICKESDIIIMFWDKKSPGTKLCLQALLDVINEK